MSKERRRLTWLKVDLAAGAELTDVLSHFLEELGAEGVYQEAEFPSPPAESPGTGKAPRCTSLTAYLPSDRREERLAALSRHIDVVSRYFPDSGRVNYVATEVTAAKWEDEWKRFFHPLRIGKHIIVKPTWEPYGARDDDIVIEIDPGMAFGTGQHHSTSLCLTMMEDLFRRDESGIHDVLDVGTGTGILGIAAVKLGAGRVVCRDIDGKAIDIARRNATINGVAERLDISISHIGRLKQPFDLVVANITAGVLIELHDRLSALTTEGGHMIISGIVKQDREVIEKRFLSPPMRLSRSLEGGDWLCYAMQKYRGRT